MLQILRLVGPPRTMPKHVRQTYNAKARQSTAGSRKKGKVKAKRDDTNPAQAEPSSNPNAEILIPKPQEQKDLERRERLRAEVRGLNFTIAIPISSLRQSRLLLSQTRSGLARRKKDLRSTLYASIRNLILHCS